MACSIVLWDGGKIAKIEMGRPINSAMREKDIKILQNLFSKLPFVRDVKVFGSRALGYPRRGSDLDLAIDAPEATPEQWPTLREELEKAPLVFDVDLVRLDKNMSDPHVSKIISEGITLYQRSNDFGEPVTA
jgi:predicted nucleotidyltransferase